MKEHERPHKSNCSRGKKRKGKEKANHIDDSRDGGSNDEISNHVQLEECLMTTDFSNYLMSDKVSATSYSNANPQMAEDSAYSTHRTLSSLTAIIDSSTSSHIHSEHDDFSSLDTSTSHNIKGFGGAQSCVVGCGTALIEV